MALTTSLVVGCGCSVPAPQGSLAGVSEYVALGDSYTAQPFVDATRASTGCLLGTPRLSQVIANNFNIPQTVDMSCSGGVIGDLNGAPLHGNQPQSAALGVSTNLVTLSIGGNDLGFSDIALACFQAAQAKRLCSDHYIVNGVDTIDMTIESVRKRLSEAVDGISNKAPNARLVIYGYPALLPPEGVEPCAGVPLNAADLPWLRTIQPRLETVIRAVAKEHGALWVDVYTPSILHGTCTQSPWVGDVVSPTPLHPTALGVTEVAQLISSAIAADFAGN